MARRITKRKKPAAASRSVKAAGRKEGKSDSARKPYDEAPQEESRPGRKPRTDSGPNAFLIGLREKIAGHRGMKRFSELCGLPYTTYRNYEIGRNVIPFAAAQAIAKATGEDPLAIVSSGRSADAREKDAAPVLPREYVLHARGKADLASFRQKTALKSRIPVSVSKDEFGSGDDFMKKGDRIAFFAKGDSMSPLIMEGDLLVFSRSIEAGRGDVVLASVGAQSSVKRYFRDAKKKIVYLASENGSHPPVVLREGKPEAKDLRVEGVLVYLRRNLR